MRTSYVTFDKAKRRRSRQYIVRSNASKRPSTRFSPPKDILTWKEGGREGGRKGGKGEWRQYGVQIKRAVCSVFAPPNYISA